METATDWPPGYPIYNIVMTLAVLHHAAHVLLGPDETDYDLVVNIRRTADTAAPGGHILGELAAAGIGVIKLQALVYDILPSTTAVFGYAIGSRKLSANEMFFCWCSNSSKCVTNNSNKTRRVIYSGQQSLRQHK